jgi:hypothetical protein
VQHKVLDALAHPVGEDLGLERLELLSDRRSLLVVWLLLLALDDVRQLASAMARVPLPVPAPRSTVRHTVAVAGDPSIQETVFEGHSGRTAS